VNLQKMLKRSKLQTRAIDSFTEYPGLTEQLLRIQGLSSESWYPPSIREALSVPAVFRAVTMISNLVGSLTMQAWRNGRVLEGQQVPTLVSRPGVFQTPRDFFRDSAYCLATRGEYLWWIVDRDDDGLAKRLMLLPPHEVTVRWNQRMPLLREYEWRNRKIDADDIEHGTFSREPGTLRGQGPLQLCGAALSAAVEADERAARFFQRGGVPSVVLKVMQTLSETDAANLKRQWLEVEGNEVRVAAGGADPQPFQVDPESAQLLDSRKYSAASVATMFGMDADLLNAAVSGSSLTYQNVGQRLDNFIRTTLGPNYLEPIEHGISERLSRTTVGRFALQTFLRADVKTQAEVYATLIGAGVEADRAAEIAGLDSLVDTLPIPAPEPIRIEVPA
jgi:HK97 family phage portal protein